MSKDQLAKQKKEVEIQPTYVPQTREGHENITNEDIQLPRIAVSQSNTKALIKKNTQYIEGLEVGQFYHTVTRQVYGDRLQIVPVLFFKNYIKFQSMEQGGGILDKATSLQEIEPGERDSVNFARPGELKALWTEFRNYVVWLPEHNEMAVISCKGTHHTAAKKLGSFIRMGNYPSYAKTYTLLALADNRKGNDFTNLDVQPGTFVSEALYEKCAKLHEDVKAAELNVDFQDEEGDASFSTEV